MSVSIYTNVALVLAFMSGSLSTILWMENDRIAWALVMTLSAIACGLLAVAGARA